MATSDRSERRETFTEKARRAQLIEITRDLIAERGYGGTSLQRIAEAAGISKPAVLYYFSSKADVIAATYQTVLAALTADMAAAVDEVGAAEAPAAYIRSMIRHLKEHPQHLRVLAEAAEHGGPPHERQDRWQPLATLIESAASARGAMVEDARTLAVIIGGAIDGIVAEQLEDPAFDSRRAAEVLVALVGTPIAAER